jgi:Tfp pilus assembly protein FimT
VASERAQRETTLVSDRLRVVRRAFTVVEILVVIVLLAAVAGLVAPRLTNTSSRRVTAAAESAAETLSALARRDAMRTSVLQRDARTGDVTWKVDPLLPDADLLDARVVAVTSDGAEVGVDAMRIEFDQYQPRPALRVVLSDAKGGNLVTVDLPASSLQASVVYGDMREQAGGSRSIDLDDEGKERQAW